MVDWANQNSIEKHVRLLYDRNAQAVFRSQSSLNFRHGFRQISLEQRRGRWGGLMFSHTPLWPAVGPCWRGTRDLTCPLGHVSVKLISVKGTHLRQRDQGKKHYIGLTSQFFHDPPSLCLQGCFLLWSSISDKDPYSSGDLFFFCSGLHRKKKKSYNW